MRGWAPWHRVVPRQPHTSQSSTASPPATRCGRLRDPLGVQWLLQTPVTLPPEQVQRALDD